MTLTQATRPRRGAHVLAAALDGARTWGWVVFPVAFFYVLFGQNSYHQYVAGFVLIYALSALSLDWLMGRAGVVSLGNGAIMAFGAFGAALLSQRGVAFPLILVLMTVAGAVLGGLLSLPALRLNGVYFALVTLALQVVVVFAARRYQASSDDFVAGIPIESPSIGSYQVQLGQPWMLLLGAILAVMVLLLRNMYTGQPGRAWMAVRESELAARTIGVPARRAKLAAFTGSTAAISLSGALLAFYTGRVAADGFTLTFAISFVVMVILGGLRSMSGVLLGAAIVTIAPLMLGQYAQNLPPLAGGFTGWFKTNVFFINSGLFGLLVMLVLLYMPRGVTPTLSAAFAGLATRLRRAGRVPDDETQPEPDAGLATRGRLHAVRPPDPDDRGARPTPALALSDVCVTYRNGALALAGIDLSIASGEIVGIVGCNGVGKSSLMRSITGFYRSEGVRLSGRIELDGKNLLGKSPIGTASLGVALVPEREKVFPELTVEEHLCHIGDLDEARAAMPKAFEMYDRKWHARAGLLSGGERQLLALAVAASLKPRILLVDEMSLGLSPIAIGNVVAAIKELQSATGVTILVVEQNVAVARDMCDRILLMEAGVIVGDWQSAPENANSDPFTDVALEGSDAANR